jgi:autotransporter-associated beta strand protein
MFTQIQISGRLLALVLGAICFGGFGASRSIAATQFWRDSAVDFNSQFSWTSFVAPTASDVASFLDGSITNQPSLTASISVGGLLLESPSDAVSFSASTLSTLTLGASGIVNNATSNPFTFNHSNISIALASSSTFTGNGTVSLGSLLNSLDLAGSTLTLNGSGAGSSIAKGIAASSGGIIKSGTGTWTLSAANAYTGGTAINDGVLSVAAANALGTSGTISFGGGVLRFSGAAGAGDYSARFSTAGGQQFKIDTNGESVTFATALASTGGTLQKSGSGTLTLPSGSVNVSGGTVVDGGVLRLSGTGNNLGTISLTSSGTLQIAATNTLSSSTAITLNGGTLQINGGAFSQSFAAAPLSMTAGSTLDFGSGLGASAMSFDDSNAQSWSGTLTVTNYSTAGGDTLRFGTSSSALTGAQLAAISFDGIGAQIDSSGFVTPVPEPAFYALALGAGSLAIATYRRRRLAAGAVAGR